MLNALRAAAKSPAALLLIGLLVISFAVWGVQDIFTGGGGANAARVGAATVTEGELRSAFDREVDRISRQSGGAFTAEQARMFGLDRQVLETLVSQAILDEKARSLNLGVSEDAILKVAQEIPAFQDPLSGRFDPAQYREVLRRNNLRPDQFEDDVRKGLARDQFTAAIGAGLAVPSAIGSARLAYFGEERRVSIVTIPASVATYPDPTEADLEETLAANADAFAAPEYRELSYFKLEVSDLIADVVLTEEDIQAEFDVRSATLTTPERRDFVELTAPSEEVADAVTARLVGGESAADVAAALELAEPLVRTGVARADVFDPAAAEAAFGLPRPGVSLPAQSAFGWKVVQVSAVTPGVTPSLEESREEIEFGLRGDLAVDLLYEAVDRFEKARDTGATLEAAARAAGAASFRVLPIDARGFDQDGERVDALADAPDMLSSAFTLAEGVESPLQEIGDTGFFVVRVEAITPARERALAEVRDAVEARWRAQAKEAALTALSAQVRENLTLAASPADAAQAVGGVSEIVELTRRDVSAHPLSPVLSRAFAAPDAAVVEARSNDGDALVARVEDIAAAGALNPADAQAVNELLANELAGDIADMVFAALEREFDVRINDAVVARATGADGATP